MLLHLRALLAVELAALEQDPVRNTDLADVVQQKAPLEAGVIGERGRDLERQTHRVRAHPRAVVARAKVARVERLSQDDERLSVGLIEQLVLAMADVDETLKLRRGSRGG